MSGVVRLLKRFKDTTASWRICSHVRDCECRVSGNKTCDYGFGSQENVYLTGPDFVLNIGCVLTAPQRLFRLDVRWTPVAFRS